MVYNIPKPTNITVFFLRTEKIESEKILRFVEVHNSKLSFRLKLISNQKKSLIQRDAAWTSGSGASQSQNWKRRMSLQRFRWIYPSTSTEHGKLGEEASLSLDLPRHLWGRDFLWRPGCWAKLSGGREVQFPKGKSPIQNVRKNSRRLTRGIL